MNVEKFSGGSYLTNSYVIYDKGEALVVDVPAHTAKKIHSFLEGKNIKSVSVILTHIHWDHVEDLEHLARMTNAKVGVHELDEANQMEINSIFEGESGQLKGDFHVVDGERIAVGSIHFAIIHTPGHTPGSICLYNEKEGVLFSGDTLFEHTYGRIDFPLSNASGMKKSLEKLAKLPGKTIVYPGHGAQTTIEKEKWLNK